MKNFKQNLWLGINSLTIQIMFVVVSGDSRKYLELGSSFVYMFYFQKNSKVLQLGVQAQAMNCLS